MAEPSGHNSGMYLTARLFSQTGAPKAPPNAVTLNAAGTPITVDLSALPPGTLVDSYATGEFFKLAYDSWVAMREPNAEYTDADVAAYVRLCWDADLERTDFHLIHVGE